MTAEPFRVQIPEAELIDLEQRLANTRWPDEAAGAGWDQGTPLGYMKDLVEYWRTAFDWRAQEGAINAFPHYRAEVGGWGIHFIHERGKGPNPMPLIMTHGWPGSFYEMLQIIPLLTDPASHGGDAADAFDVVVPSLPGYGFSDHRVRRGPIKVYELWLELMAEVLGYERFAAYGYDVGAGVTGDLGRCPEQVIGIYISSDYEWPSPMPEESGLSDVERDFLRRAEQWEKEEGGYSHIQGTRPQTLAYGLNDSPAALAAWIVEKFYAWGDCDGDIERRFTKDQLLTNVSIYWFTQTIASSMRGYYEGQHNAYSWREGKPIAAPTALAMFPKDFHVPREWAARSYPNLQRWSEMPSGGHFAAMEEPELLARDIRAFFRILREHPCG